MKNTVTIVGLVLVVVLLVYLERKETDAFIKDGAVTSGRVTYRGPVTVGRGRPATQLINYEYVVGDQKYTGGDWVDREAGTPEVPDQPDVVFLKSDPNRS